MLESIQHYRQLGWRVSPNSHDQLIYSKQVNEKGPESFFAINASRAVVEFAGETKNGRRRRWI